MFHCLVSCSPAILKPTPKWKFINSTFTFFYLQPILLSTNDSPYNNKHSSDIDAIIYSVVISAICCDKPITKDRFPLATTSLLRDQCQPMFPTTNRSSTSNQADLARQREPHLTTARAVQIPKYGQIRTESRLFRSLSRRHLTFPSCC